MSMSEYYEVSQRLDDLRGLEREYRPRLRAYMEDCLATVDGGDLMVPLRAAAHRLSEASDGDLKAVLAELPEARRKRLLTVLLRTPVPEVTG